MGIVCVATCKLEVLWHHETRLQIAFGRCAWIMPGSGGPMNAVSKPASLKHPIPIPIGSMYGILTYMYIKVQPFM